MSEMMKSLRSGADRAAFEAGKLMRLQRIQLQQRSRERERRQVVEQLGEATWQLYAEGRISDPELVGLCHQIQTATHEIAEMEKAVAKVRGEQTAKTPDGATCAGCGRAVRAGAVFCAHCGRRVGAAA